MADRIKAYWPFTFSTKVMFNKTNLNWCSFMLTPGKNKFCMSLFFEFEESQNR